MPIRWSALKVSEAADMMEEFIKQAAEPLEQVRIVAREARKLPNLPQYIDWEFGRIIGEVDRAIGGSRKRRQPPKERSCSQHCLTYNNILRVIYYERRW